MTTTTKRPACRKIEPVLVRNAAGHLIEQSCGTCGYGLEATPTGWRHDGIKAARA